MKSSKRVALIVGGVTLAFVISAVTLRLGADFSPWFDTVSQEGRETLNMFERMDEKERIEEDKERKRLNDLAEKLNAEAAARRAARGNAPPEPDPNGDSTAPRAASNGTR